MNDIVERLRRLAERERPYGSLPDTLDEAAAEIERLRARLEIDPSHPYDGIYARDETIRQQDKQIERLRAALEWIADTDPDDGTAWFHNVARAALEAAHDR